MKKLLLLASLLNLSIIAMEAPRGIKREAPEIPELIEPEIQAQQAKRARTEQEITDPMQIEPLTPLPAEPFSWEPLETAAPMEGIEEITPRSTITQVPVPSPFILSEGSEIPVGLLNTIDTIIASSTGQTPSERLYNAARNVRDFLSNNRELPQRFLNNENFTEKIIVKLAKYATGDVVKAALAFDTPAAQNILAKLIKKNPAPFYSIAHYLFNAAREGDLKDFNILLYVAPENTINNFQGPGGITLLMTAVANSHVPIVEQLLTLGANVNSVTQYGDTALHFATLTLKPEISNVLVQKLIAAGVHVNQAAKNVSTPLFLASARGLDTVVETLIAAHADVNKVLRDGVSPLIAASKKGYAFVVEKLLAAGANPHLRDSTGNTALHYAQQNGYKDIVEKITQAAKSYVAAYHMGPQGMPRQIFPPAPQTVRPMPPQGGPVPAPAFRPVPPPSRENALINAVKKGQADVVRNMLSKRIINLEHKDMYGKTALDYAIEKGDKAIENYIRTTMPAMRMYFRPAPAPIPAPAIPKAAAKPASSPSFPPPAPPARPSKPSGI